MATLAYTRVVAPDTTPGRWLLALHGILGSGDNWRAAARQLTSARPEWGAALADLRMHGKSQDAAAPHTVEAAAEDLDSIVAELDGPVAGLLGHSFGGKVALARAAHHPDSLEQLWVVDCAPGPSASTPQNDSADRAVEMLRQLPATFPSRHAFVQQVREHGFDDAVAQWLAKNLARGGDGQLQLRLDPEAIGALLADHRERDLWSVVEDPPGTMQIHLVVGGASNAFDADSLERARRAETDHARVHLHVIEGAGHWVHVDARQTLVELIARHL